MQTMLHDWVTGDSLPHFENRTTAQVNVRSVVLCTKKLHFVSLNWRMENSSVAHGISSIKIDYSDHLKSLISRINEVYVCFFSIKYRLNDI